jgi:hypothetical protein
MPNFLLGFVGGALPARGRRFGDHAETERRASAFRNSKNPQHAEQKLKPRRRRLAIA